jgi:hypothetical protein
MKREIADTDVRRVILDVLKPHSPNIIELSQKLASLDGTSGVNIMLEEVDQETENIKVTIEGRSIDYDEVVKVIETMGGAVHSIDSVSVGKRLVEFVETLQDR